MARSPESWWARALLITLALGILAFVLLLSNDWRSVALGVLFGSLAAVELSRYQRRSR